MSFGPGIVFIGIFILAVCTICVNGTPGIMPKDYRKISKYIEFLYKKFYNETEKIIFRR